jgi:protein-S-isoprenylcysteine O-methyltransferase Ste14
MLELIIFIVCSAALFYISRASLRVPHSHGFFRFFAWEFILALILLNLRRWFKNLFALHQIISWLLLTVSIVLVLHGLYLLRLVGRPDDRRKEDVPLIGIEKTTSLVTVGAYKYIRHPLYSSGFFGAWGVFFKDPSLLGGILALAATIFLLITAKVEEAECTRFFGPAYQAYMKGTKMFVPFLF